MVKGEIMKVSIRNQNLKRGMVIPKNVNGFGMFQKRYGDHVEWQVSRETPS